MAPIKAKQMSSDNLLLAVSCFVSLGVFLFGYDQGVISGLLTGPYFKRYFHQPTPMEIGSMVSSLELAAFITALAAGQAADIYGRRRTIFWGAVMFTIGGAIQTFANGFAMMVFGRCIAGFGIGFLSMCVPIMQSEISPAEHRGMFACIEFTGNIVGYASSVWIDYFASYLESDLSWRIPLAVQIVIGSILAIGSLFVPESPRWLLDTDQDLEGFRVLVDLRGDGDLKSRKAKQEFREIKENVLADRKAGDRTYYKMWKKYRNRVLIAMSSQMFAQLNGINVISYYCPLVMESGGWIGRDALFMTGLNGIVYILCTIPPWYIVDRWGRRPILIGGGLAMAAALLSMAYFIAINAEYTPKAVVASVFVFNGFFGASWGPIPWLYPPEIMPLPYRVKGVSLSTATNWAFNYYVGMVTPVFQQIFGYKLYVGHAISCILSCILVYFCYPETKGVPLEKMASLFGDEDSEDVEERAALVSSLGEQEASYIEPPHHKDVEAFDEQVDPFPTRVKNFLIGSRPSTPDSSRIEQRRSSSRDSSRSRTGAFNNYQSVSTS